MRRKWLVANRQEFATLVSIDLTDMRERSST
jgi:hypothetical protein